MADRKRQLTQDEVRRLFHYEPSTGVITWLVSRTNRVKVGAIAGVHTSVGTDGSHGYVQISIGHEKYPAHNLAWLYMTGDWPVDEIDHVNRVRHDNRWENLRPASRSQQIQNQALRKDSSSGHRGVAWAKGRGKWQAYISINGKRVSLGRFEEKDDAIAAYRRAALKHYGEFAAFEAEAA